MDNLNRNKLIVSFVLITNILSTFYKKLLCFREHTFILTMKNGDKGKKKDLLSSIST